jgi:hypothetical protein
MEGREMAYNPTTWGSNDVITKDRLNKMEQGIVSASKLSGTDIDTDKDWGGKSINNVNMLTVNKIKATSYLWTPDQGLTKPRYIDNTLVRNSTYSWVTVKTTPPAKIGVLGAATIYYNFSTTYDANIRLLKNDVVVPNSTKTVKGDGSIAIDVPITTGDIFKLQLNGYTSNNSITNTNFGIYALMTPIIDENETWS